LVVTTGSVGLVTEAYSQTAARPIYTNGFAAGFGYNQWNGTNDPAHSTTVRSGTSISTVMAGHSGIYISIADGEALSTYDSFQFWVNGGSAGLSNAYVEAQGIGVTPNPQFIQAVAANQWVQVTVSMQTLVGNKAFFDTTTGRYLRIASSQSSTAPVFLDDLELTSGGTAATTTTTSTTLPSGPTTTSAPSGASKVIHNGVQSSPDWITYLPGFQGGTVTSDGITFNVTAGLSADDRALRFIGTATGFNKLELQFTPAAAGRSVAVQAKNKDTLADIGFPTVGIVDASGKATMTIPSSGWSMLYLPAMDPGSYTMRSATLLLGTTSGGPSTSVPGKGL
jgi:hypothetical protein